MELEQFEARIKELEDEVAILKKENSQLKKKAFFFDEQLRYSKNFFYRLNLKNKCYDYISDYVYELTGLTVEEFSKKNLSDAFIETHPEDLPILKKAINSLHESKDKVPYQSIKYRRKIRDKYFWVRNDMNAIKDENGELIAFLGTTTNITEEKEIEFQLIEGRQLSQEILDCSPNIIYMKGTDGKYIFINKSMAKLFEVEQDELLKRLNSDYESFSYDCDLLDKHEADVIKSGVPLQMNERFISPSGKKYWLHTIKTLHTVNNNKYLLVNSTDLTQLRESQIQLRNSEVTLKAIINATDDLILLVGSDHKIITVNKSAAKISRFPMDFILGKTVHDLYNEKVADHRTNLLLKVINTKKRQKSEEYYQGSYYEVTLYPVLDEDDKDISQIVIIIRDITSLKQAEIETKKLLEKEKELSELKSNVLSTVSHEFRTPLSIILSNVQQLKKYRKVLKPEELNKKTIMIENSIKHMNYMLSNISVLDKSDRELLRFDPIEVNIRILIQDLVQEVKLLYNNSDRIEVDFKDEIEKIIVDETLIRHILINLLTNAMKYSCGESKVELTASLQNTNLLIKIQDYGIGIKKSELNNIWEPFYRGSNVSNIKGTGLGATIVKKCVELHGGSIIINSKKNEGTLIELSLPFRIF